jgi:hypothetical protein
MDTLDKYIDYLISEFGRRISPRLSTQERLQRLVYEEYPHLSDNERSEIITRLIVLFNNFTIHRCVSHHSMNTRSMIY